MNVTQSLLNSKYTIRIESSYQDRGRYHPVMMHGAYSVFLVGVQQWYFVQPEPAEQDPLEYDPGQRTGTGSSVRQTGFSPAGYVFRVR